MNPDDVRKLSPALEKARRQDSVNALISLCTIGARQLAADSPEMQHVALTSAIYSLKFLGVTDKEISRATLALFKPTTTEDLDIALDTILKEMNE